MKNMFFLKSRYDYEEEVNEYAHECFYEPNTTTAEEIAKDYINCAKDVESEISPDFRLKETETEVWDILENYDYANYSIFSAMEFAENVLEMLKKLSEENNDQN